MLVICSQFQIACIFFFFQLLFQIFNLHVHDGSTKTNAKYFHFFFLRFHGLVSNFGHEQKNVMHVREKNSALKQLFVFFFFFIMIFKKTLIQKKTRKKKKKKNTRTTKNTGERNNKETRNKTCKNKRKTTRKNAVCFRTIIMNHLMIIFEIFHVNLGVLTWTLITLQKYRFFFFFFLSRTLISN